MVVTEALAGGIVSSLANICNHLPSDEFEIVLVYSRRRESPSDEQLRVIYGKHVRLVQIQGSREINPANDLKLLLRYWRILRQESPDIVHFHSSKAGFVGRFAARLALISSRSVFYSPRGFSFLRTDTSPGKRRLYWLLEKIAGMAGGHIIAVSASEAHEAQRLVGAGRTILVDNGLDLSALGAIEAPATKPPGATWVIGTVGRLSAQKDPMAFLDLAQAVVAHYPGKARFLWVGGGELAATFETEVARRNLSGVVEATGWVPREEAWKRLQSEVDIYVQTSQWEGMPLTVLEAMAFTKPVVVRDAVGNRDVVAHGVTGYVGKDVREMVDYLSRLMADPGYMAQMGQSGRRRLEEHYTVARVVRELAAVYRAPLGRPHG